LPSSVTFYELLTGRLPFTAPDFLSMGFKHLTEQPTLPTRHNPQVPAATLKAMAKQRAERYADIPAFLAALRTPFTQATVLRASSSTFPIQPTLQASTSPAPAPLVQAFPARTKEQWLNECTDHCYARRYAEALSAYEQAIRLDPKYALAYYGKGVALDKLKRYEEALSAYEQAIRLDPSYDIAYANKGDALKQLGRQTEAQQAYDKVRQLCGKS
jgi:tetratricopeptide (TPR) repeat protein